MLSLYVLVADQDADIRATVALSLQRDPFFVVRGCASVADALKLALAWRPDLALLAANMPGMEARGALLRLRTDPRTAAIPVVLTAARAEQGECARWRTFGAAGVLAKPFDTAALADQMRRFVPLEGVLAAARANFLARLEADACALSECRHRLSRTESEQALRRINAIAHALAGAGGIYGFAGISCESAALSQAAEDGLAGRVGALCVEQALDRLLRRIDPGGRPVVPFSPPRKASTPRYSAATA